MKDFTLRNDTKLLFRNEPKTDLSRIKGFYLFIVHRQKQMVAMMISKPLRKVEMLSLMNFVLRGS